MQTGDVARDFRRLWLFRVETLTILGLASEKSPPTFYCYLLKVGLEGLDSMPTSHTAYTGLGLLRQMLKMRILKLFVQQR